MGDDSTCVIATATYLSVKILNYNIVVFAIPLIYTK
jgi:hypothetical protein